MRTQMLHSSETICLDGLKLPHISAASLLDLSAQSQMTNGRIAKAKPSDLIGTYRALGKETCKKAFSLHSSLLSGAVGAGTSAAVWNMLESKSRGGLGSASLQLRDGIVVGAVIAVNVFGVLDTSKMTLDFLNSTDTPASWVQSSHTAIGVVATNLKLSRTELQKVTQMAFHGIVDAVFPASTM
jgi:L-aminopeptidase/D-esterase-like protein